MVPYRDSKHIRELLQTKELACLETADSIEAYSFLQHNFPIEQLATTSIIDWTQIVSCSLDWLSASDDETLTWAKQTLAGKHQFGLLFFNTEEPCFIGKFNFVIRNLDVLTWRPLSPFLVFGVDREQGDKITFSVGVIECTVHHRLFASIEPR